MDYFIPDVSKVESFNGSYFKRWQKKFLFLLKMANVAYVLFEPRVQESEDQLEPAWSGIILNWNKANKICLNSILNTLSNELYDLYCVEEFARDV